MILRKRTITVHVFMYFRRSILSYRSGCCQTNCLDKDDIIKCPSVWRATNCLIWLQTHRTVYIWKLRCLSIGERECVLFKHWNLFILEYLLLTLILPYFITHFFFVRSLLSNTNIDQTNFFFHVYTFFFFVHLQIDKHLNDIGGAVVDTKNINISNRGIIIYSMFSEVARIKLTHWNQNYLIVIASVIHHLYILTAPNDWANIWECVASIFTNVLYHILIMIITRFFPSFFSSFFPSVSFYLFLFHYPYVFPINISLFAFWTVATNIWCHWHFEIEYV